MKILDYLGITKAQFQTDYPQAPYELRYWEEI